MVAVHRLKDAEFRSVRGSAIIRSREDAMQPCVHGHDGPDARCFQCACRDKPVTMSKPRQLKLNAAGFRHLGVSRNAEPLEQFDERRSRCHHFT